MKNVLRCLKLALFLIIVYGGAFVLGASWYKWCYDIFFKIKTKENK